MSDQTTGRAPLARNLGVLLGGAVVVELAFAAFLFVMAGLAAGASSSNTDHALVFGAVASVLAGVVALALWVSTRSAGEATVAVWTARLLPVVAVAVALVIAAFGGVPWLAVPLVFFTTTPVSVVAMVVPQLLATQRQT